MSAPAQMTAEEFIAAPVPDRGRPWNLVDGEVVVNDPTLRHASAQMSIVAALRAWAEAESDRGLANIGVDIGLDGRNVFVPDALWWREGRAPTLDDQPPYPMPDLAVEVRSPSTWRYDVGAKRSAYERHGLPELWLVDTVARTVLVNRRSDAGASGFDVAAELEAADALTSPHLDGFALPVETIFGR